MQELLRRGVENGLMGLRVVGRYEIREIAALCRVQGIFVPQAGIVDYDQIAERRALRISREGAEVMLCARVDSLRPESSASS